MSANGEARKSACLGMPGYAQLTGGAALGFYRASRGLDLRLHQTESSLLAHNMNRLWCWALNAARISPVHYFAMQHSDIEPKEFWLDDLVAELEARDLDVLGVVAPIKDQRGVTSTAVARDDGSTWRVNHRLTMREVHRLPETFTSDDVGGQLLINTGCWVCRFDPAWAAGVWFETQDRVEWDAAGDRYAVLTEPEDWGFARKVAALGLRVGVTRKVPLGHVGGFVFESDSPWGEFAFDEEYTDSPLVARPLPAGVP